MFTFCRTPPCATRFSQIQLPSPPTHPPGDLEFSREPESDENTIETTAAGSSRSRKIKGRNHCLQTNLKLGRQYLQQRVHTHIYTHTRLLSVFVCVAGRTTAARERETEIPWQNPIRAVPFITDVHPGYDGPINNRERRPDQSDTVKVTRPRLQLFHTSSFSSSSSSAFVLRQASFSRSLFSLRSPSPPKSPFPRPPLYPGR